MKTSYLNLVCDGLERIFKERIVIHGISKNKK
jgi:hypothetical protein